MKHQLLAVFFLGGLLATPVHAAKKPTPPKPPAKPKAAPPPKVSKPVVSKPAYGDFNLALYALKFTSKSCKECKAMQPHLDQLSLEKDFKGLMWIAMDLSDDKTKEDNLKAAKKLGVEGVYGKYKTKAGPVVLVNPQSKKEAGVLDPKDTKAQMAEKIRKALKN